MINASMQSMFKDYKVMNEPLMTIKVPFQSEKLVGDLGRLYYNEMLRCAGPSGSRALEDIDAERVEKYLSTLVAIRCIEATGSFTKAFAPYRVFRSRAAVPTVWYQVLIGIGEALDAERAIKLVPSVDVSSEDLLSPDEMQHISDEMFMLQARGFAVTAGVPKGAAGELEFMAMSHADGVVKSYLPKSHPVFGFMASFFNTKIVADTLGVLVRPIYGFDEDYRGILAEVIRSSNGG